MMLDEHHDAKERKEDARHVEKTKMLINFLKEKFRLITCPPYTLEMLCE